MIDMNPVNTEVNQPDIHFVHRRERLVLRLVRPVSDCSAGKWLFIVKICTGHVN